MRATWKRSRRTCFVDKMDDVLQLALGVRSKRSRPRRKKRKVPEPEAAVN
jgi:hypothetical protein